MQSSGVKVIVNYTKQTKQQQHIYIHLYTCKHSQSYKENNVNWLRFISRWFIILSDYMLFFFHLLIYYLTNISIDEKNCIARLKFSKWFSYTSQTKKEIFNRKKKEKKSMRKHYQLELEKRNHKAYRYGVQ